MESGTSGPTPESIAKSLASGTMGFTPIVGTRHKGRKFTIGTNNEEYSLHHLIDMVKTAADNNKISPEDLQKALGSLLKLNVTPPLTGANRSHILNARRRHNNAVALNKLIDHPKFPISEQNVNWKQRVL